MRGRGSIRTGALGAIALVALLTTLAAGAQAAPVRFAKPVFVDRALAGGEPLVIADKKHHTLIYTAHEGTTHLYRNGIVNPVDFVPNYRNQVNIWVSKNDGRTWTRVDFAGTGFDQPPSQNTGFSDPDLTMDAGGRVYNTGIDLANDALFSTANGGYNWDRGTAECHDGDRPWLAGGRRDEVFMGTDTLEGSISHQIFQSTDGGNTCSTNGIPDGGTLADGTSYAGDGKLMYDHHNGRLMEPVVFSRSSGGPLGSTKTIGVGVATWKRGQGSTGRRWPSTRPTTLTWCGTPTRASRGRAAAATVTRPSCPTRSRCRSRVISARRGRIPSPSRSRAARRCTGRGSSPARLGRCRSSGTRPTRWWTWTARRPRRRSTTPRS
ncbi:MAG: hypothetical protein E6G07_08890 [Actinobacteria bacterium]|nr:MAG: hypothetical protein E6G07_08890 [Actinomycetota bacterium]